MKHANVGIVALALIVMALCVTFTVDITVTIISKNEVALQDAERAQKRLAERLEALAQCNAGIGNAIMVEGVICKNHR